MYCTMRRVKDRLLTASYLAIVGAGFWGEKIITDLQKEREDFDQVSVVVFDNKKAGQMLCGYPIGSPCLLDDDRYFYVIASGSDEIRGTLYKQLINIGVKDENLAIYYPGLQNYIYLSRLPESDYHETIDDLYFERFGKRMDWTYPKTYSEIINWEKLNVKDERRSRLADKYLVKQWVSEQIGEEFVPKLLGVWDNAKDIDFNLLPNQFVLKINRGSIRNIIVTDKSTINEDEIRQQLNEWMKENFAFCSLELHYGSIVPKIICEEYLDGIGEDLYDYEVYCFGGKPEYIECIKACKKATQASAFYDTDWNKQDFSYGYPMDHQPAPRPKQLEQMLELSRVLSREFPHVRVDWYITREGKILFSEMTFSTWSGLSPFSNEKYDALFGELILKQTTVRDEWHTFLCKE